MSNMEAFEDGVRAVLREALQVEVPSAETDLIESGVMDSLGFVEVLTRLEQRFGIQISLESVDIDQLRSIRAIATFLADRTQPVSAIAQ